MKGAWDTPYPSFKSLPNPAIDTLLQTDYLAVKELGLLVTLQILVRG